MLKTKHNQRDLSSQQKSLREADSDSDSFLSAESDVEVGVHFQQSKLGGGITFTFSYSKRSILMT